MNEDIHHIITLKGRITNAMRFQFAEKKKRKGYKTRKKKKGISGIQLGVISRKLTGVVKTRIRQQGHVDTGKMLRKTKVIATIGARGELVAKIFSTDYWKYVDGNFDILINSQKTRKWKEIEKMFNEFNVGHPNLNR